MNYDTIPFGYLISLTENQLSGISNPIYAKGFTIHENNNPEAPVSINFETNDDGSIILTKVSPGSDTSSKCLVDDLPLSGQVQLQHGSTIDTHIGKFLFHYVKLSTFNPEHPDYVKVKKNISPNKLSKLNSGGKENIASVKKKTWSTIVNDNKKPVVKKIENIIKKNVFKPSKRSIGSKLMSDAKTPTAVKRLKNLYTTGHCDSPETIIIKKPKEELRKIAMKRDNQFAASTSPFVSKGRKREKNFTPSNKKKVAKDCIAFNILQVKPDSPALPSRLVGAGNSSKLASGRTPRRQLTDEVGQQSSSKAGQEGGDEVGEEGDLPRETSMEEVAASSSNPSEKDALVQRLWADDEDQQLAVNEIAQVSEAACANPSNISTEQINEAEQPNDIVEQKLPLEIKGVQIKNKKNLYSDIVKQNKLKSSLPKRPAIVTPSKNLNNFIVKQSKLKLTLPKAHAIIKPSKKHSKLDCNKGIVQSASMVQAFKNIYSTGHISSPSTIVINKSKAPMRKLNSSENEISGKKSLSRNSLALKMPKANANCQARSSPRRLAFQNSLISIPKDDVIQLNSGSKKQELSLEHDIIPESPMITKLFESSKNDSIPESPMISKLFQDHNVSETLIVSDNVASPKGPTTMSSPAESEMKTKLCENVSSEEATRDVRILRSSPRKAAKKINKKIVSLEKAITDSLPDSPMITKLFEDNKPANESLSNEIPKKADISENAKLSKLFKNVVKSNEVRNLRSSPRRNANKKNNLHDTDSIPESPMIAKLFENIEIPEKENENTVKSTSRKIYKTQKKIVQKVTADNLPNSPMITKLFEDHKLVNEYITNEASKEENEVKDLRSSTRRKDNKKNDLIVTENEVKDLRSNRRKANKKNDLIVTENEVKDLRSNKRKDNKKNDLIVTENEVKDLRSTRRKANKKNDLLVTDSIQESPIIAKIFENIEIPEKENENKVKSTSRKRVQKANETSLRSSSRNIKVDNSLPKTIEDKEVEETFDTTSANFNSTSEIKLNKASIVSDKVSSPIKKKTNKKRAPKINVKNSAKKLDKNTKEDVIEKPVVDIVDEVVTCEIEILEPEKEVKLRRNGRKKATNNTIVKQLEPQVSGRTRSAKMISEDNAEISLPAKKTRVKKNKSADKITSDETDLPPKKRRLNNIIDNENVCNSDDKSETNESKKVTEELQVSCIRKTRSTKNIKEEESDPVNEIKPMKNTRARSKNKPEGKPQKKTTKSKDKIEQVVVRMTRSKQKDIDTSTKRITRIRV